MKLRLRKINCLLAALLMLSINVMPAAAATYWSNAPWDLTPNRACMYNLKLGDDPGPAPGGPPVGNPPSSVPYLNHALHEFGHALGLAHEHQRNDVNAPCPAYSLSGR